MPWMGTAGGRTEHGTRNVEGIPVGSGVLGVLLVGSYLPGEDGVRVLFDVYAMWVPLALCLSLLGCGFMLGWMAKDEWGG